MRIIHTADWHLGKMFYGDYLTGDQRAVLVEQFLPLLAEYKPDAVILAGDVYDRSLPPVEAVELFDEVATKIVKDLCLPFSSLPATTTARSDCPSAAGFWRRRNSMLPVTCAALRDPLK